MCILDSSTRMGSERFWAKEAVIRTPMIHEMTLNTLLSRREVWTLCYIAQYPHSRLKCLCPSCWGCWLLTALQLRPSLEKAFG